MTATLKCTLQTLLFYTLYIIVCIILEMIMPTGGHAPGVGLITFIFLPIVVLLLLIANIVNLINGKKQVKYSIIIHCIFLLVVLGVFIYYSNY